MPTGKPPFPHIRHCALVVIVEGPAALAATAALEVCHAGVQPYPRLPSEFILAHRSRVFENAGEEDRHGRKVRGEPLHGFAESMAQRRPGDLFHFSELAGFDPQAIVAVQPLDGVLVQQDDAEIPEKGFLRRVLSQVGTKCRCGLCVRQKYVMLLGHADPFGPQAVEPISGPADKIIMRSIYLNFNSLLAISMSRSAAS
jgi:hypothetical protein